MYDNMPKNFSNLPCLLISFINNRSLFFFFVFVFCFLFFFQKEFYPMSFASNDCFFYHQIKTPFDFICRRGLNFRSLIQLLETLPVELTGIHSFSSLLYSSFIVKLYNILLFSLNKSMIKIIKYKKKLFNFKIIMGQIRVKYKNFY